MSEWMPIETAPKGGRAFLALNHDGEMWVARYTDDNRLCFRNNQRREPRKFTVHRIDGKELLEEDKQYAEANEHWASDWCFWTRLYEFKPTHFLPLPPPPGAAA